MDFVERFGPWFEAREAAEVLLMRQGVIRRALSTNQALTLYAIADIRHSQNNFYTKQIEDLTHDKATATSQSLKSFLEYGLIERESPQSASPKIYGLTELGRQVIDLFSFDDPTVEQNPSLS